MKDNFMVDLETMGTTPYSAIVSIGVVQFDLKTGELGKEFYRTIDLQSCLDAGLHTDQSTVDWWKKQSQATRDKLYIDTKPLSVVLQEFSGWLKNITDSYKYMWGNSASFDLGLLSQAYNKLNLPIPWAFWNERCCRTIVALNEFIKEKTAKPSGAHDPIIDCKVQIDYVVRTIKSISR